MIMILTAVVLTTLLTLTISTNHHARNVRDVRDVIDCIMYNGEIDILLLRLHHLNTTVDRFIIAESKCTFSSLPKPSYFHDRDRKHPAIQEFLPRIIHVAAQQECDPLSSNAAPHDPWEMEKDLRNVVLQGIPKNISSSTLIMLSDVDEFPSVLALEQARSTTSACQTGVACHFDATENMYYYDLSHRVVTEEWYHPQIITYEDVLRNIWTPQEIRDIGFELSRGSEVATTTTHATTTQNTTTFDQRAPTFVPTLVSLP